MPETSDTSSALRESMPETPDTSSTFIDKRDGQKYMTAVIGGARWMTRNLNYKADSSWCYKNDDSYCALYGRLYDWETATTVCPAGYHLPSREEWAELVDYAGGHSAAGNKLKTKRWWKDYCFLTPCRSGNGYDTYGFSALPGGLRSSGGIDRGEFMHEGSYGYWWTATEGFTGGAYHRSINSSDGVVQDFSRDKDIGFSVRCVQNRSGLDSVVARKQNFVINFIGYDELTPIFVSIEWIKGAGVDHDGMYKYANGRLTEMDIPLPKRTRCFKVKNGVYLFGYGGSKLYDPTEIQFKRNGQGLLSKRTVTWTTGVIPNIAAMNDEEFFIIAERGTGDRRADPAAISNIRILRMKYRNQSRIDTIKIDGNNYGYCLELIDATNDHLYFIVEYPEDPDDVGYFGPPGGSLYRMNLNDGSVDELVKNVESSMEELTAIAPHLNIACSNGSLADYNTGTRIWPKDYDPSHYRRLFFSYEQNAFVNYATFSNVNGWECYNLAPGGKMPTELREVPCFNKNKGTK